MAETSLPRISRAATMWPVRLPAEVERLCLLCGRERADDGCDECGVHEPARWRPPASSPILSSLLVVGALLIGVAMFALGIAVVIGPYQDGERRPWALISFGALGLGLAFGGGALLSGFRPARERSSRRRPDLHFTVGRPHDEADFAEGAAHLKGGRLALVEGESVRVMPLAPAKPLGEPVGATSEALATLVEVGAAKIHVDRIQRWQWAPTSGEPSRSTRDVPRLEAAADHGGKLPLAEACQLLLSAAMRDCGDLVATARQLESEPLRLNQLRAMTQGLRDRGVDPSPELIRSVEPALVAAEAASGAHAADGRG